MLATLIKILPVLWPYFKEMILGGDKEPGETERPTRLKALFYVIMMLLVLLGYGGYQAFNLMQRLHESDTQNARLQGELHHDDEIEDSLRDDLKEAKANNAQLMTRIIALRDKEVSLTGQLAQRTAQYEDQKQQKEAMQKLLDEASENSRNLKTFNTSSPKTPKSLKEHNKAVDVLKQLSEEARDVER